MSVFCLSSKGSLLPSLKHGLISIGVTTNSVPSNPVYSSNSVAYIIGT